MFVYSQIIRETKKRLTKIGLNKLDITYYILHVDLDGYGSFTKITVSRSSNGT